MVTACDFVVTHKYSNVFIACYQIWHCIYRMSPKKVWVCTCLAAASASFCTMEALVLKRSSRVIPTSRETRKRFIILCNFTTYLVSVVPQLEPQPRRNLAKPHPIHLPNILLPEDKSKAVQFYEKHKLSYTGENTFT